MPEFQIHIVGHFCKVHQPLIWVYQMEDRGPLVEVRLIATYPEGEVAVDANDLQRYADDMLGRDIPTRIIPNIMGYDQLHEALEREVIEHTRDADEWIARLLLGNLVGTILDANGGLRGSYL